ncbi:MAG: hypothetical protein ABIJ34_07895 [archaeon]
MGNLIIFEIIVVVLSGGLLLALKKKNKEVVKRFFLLSIGILIFEMFTSPLWHNVGLDPWAYLYMDVSWILTIGWASILLFSMTFVDYVSKAKEKVKFFYYLCIASFLGLVAEAWVILLGIRSYSPEVNAILIGKYIPLTGVPVEAIYYIPVFMALVIGFARYFEMATTLTEKRKKKNGMRN